MLDMSGNSALTLTETAFQETPYLEEIYLNAMQLGTTTPPNVFKTLKFLRLLNLESNGITGELIEDLINPVLNPITSLSFNNNKITQIHHLAITGMKASGTVHLRNNKIEYLHQANWETLVTQLNTAGAIDVRDNPLVCGCDVKWLVFDKDLMAAFHIDTTCATGNKLAELPQDWFLDHCLS
ncbi:pan-1 [Chionoecetes opilio]|uniref:Pan-1 n=1 Tax=Chionoecetes opilio TaxID=41210 RepID=A0A8J5D280_CHIOP|nr:pan-1 [Chionoecetes opilio]